MSEKDKKQTAASKVNKTKAETEAKVEAKTKKIAHADKVTVKNQSDDKKNGKQIEKPLLNKTQSKSASKHISKPTSNPVAKPTKANEKVNNMTNQSTNSSNVATVKSSGKGLSIFATLLSLGALGVAGFTWYQTQVGQVQSNTSIAVGVTEIGGQVTRLGDTIGLIKEQQNNAVTKQQLLNQLNKTISQLDEKIEPMLEQQTVLGNSIATINEGLAKGVNEYKLDEVMQLLKLANYSVDFSGNTSPAISALTLADAHLQELSNPKYAGVRQKINEEISNLKNIDRPDIEGMSATLNTLSALVPSLPLANEPEAKAILKPLAVSAANNVSVSNTASVNWRSELKKIWSDVKGSVQVQRVDQPPKPLLVPEQRYFLNQNLQLNLSKAELALLQERQGVYEQSIAGASKWLNDYFDLNNNRVQSTIKQLESLKTQKVTVELPDITGSYSALKLAYKPIFKPTLNSSSINVSQ